MAAEGVAGAGVAVAVTVALLTAGVAGAEPVPGMAVQDEDATCTAGFAAQGLDGAFYLMTSGHCDDGDGSPWTGPGGALLGPVTASEDNDADRDAAIIRLDPAAGPPVGAVAGRYPVRDVLNPGQIQPGLPVCKVGAISGETCGVVTGVDGFLVRTDVFSLFGDSGSPAFVKNSDGTASAVGILLGSPVGDDFTTYFTMVDPLLRQWGLRILP